MPFDCVEALTFDDAILEIDTDHAQIEKTRDIAGQLIVVIAVPAFEIDRNGEIDRRRDPRNDLLGELDRDGLAVAVTLRFRDGPAACGDRGRACFNNGFCTARIPRIVEQQRRAFDVIM